MNSIVLRLSVVPLLTAILLTLSSGKQRPSPRQTPQPNLRLSFAIVLLETVSETSANAGIGDVNGDGSPDIVLAKGRHWPVPSHVFLGDGHGHFTPGPDLPSEATKSYSASLADMTKSGRLDMALSNDQPEPKLVLTNDGRGNFHVAATYGKPSLGHAQRGGR